MVGATEWQSKQQRWTQPASDQNKLGSAMMTQLHKSLLQPARSGIQVTLESVGNGWKGLSPSSFSSLVCRGLFPLNLFRLHDVIVEIGVACHLQKQGPTMGVHEADSVSATCSPQVVCVCLVTAGKKNQAPPWLSSSMGWKKRWCVTHEPVCRLEIHETLKLVTGDGQFQPFKNRNCKHLLHCFLPPRLTAANSEGTCFSTCNHVSFT